MATQKLNITRDQLATFLGNHELIKQFENLIAVADEVASASDTTGISIQAGNADAAANEALAQIVRLAQDSAIDAGVADQKATQALETLGRIANALEMLAAAPVIQNNNSVVTDYIDLPEIGPHITQPRRVQWNPDDGTVDIGLYGGSVLQVGQEIHYYAKNTSGSLIPNGTPVMFTGIVGSSGKLTFGLAIADGSVPAEYMMGVTTQDIANNAFGYVTNFGLVRGFNTTGVPYGEVWSDGDLLYFDPTTAGTWTNVQPVAPNISVPVAVVINAGSGGSGSVFVRMELSESLNNLQDVYINGGGPLAGQVMIYDQTQKRWENHYLTAGTNVSITNADGSIVINSSNPGGTVTSVGLSAPTGFTVSGSPVTSSGTLALSFAAGYSLPTTTSQTNWDTAYSERRQWDGGSTSLVPATGRTSLGATTVGSNLFTLANPSAVTYVRINADNSVSTLDAATFRTAIGAGTGTVTGVTASSPLASSGGTAPNITITGSALTKTDDTNVTMTLGGTPATALLAAASITLGWTGTLAVARGGIGTGTAGIGAFNNITGYTSSGATGTTSTNLVFSTSPTLTTPKVTTTLGVGNATPSASGAGVSFPATQSASTDPNTLDDYEEGTFNCNYGAFSSISGSWGQANCTYTKIGRHVFVSATITGTGMGVNTNGYIQFTGMPFTVAVNSAGSWGSTSISSQIAGTVVATSTEFWLYASNNNNTTGSIWLSFSFPV